MVNGNYILYGDRPSSDSEFIDDHVRTRTAERKKNKRKFNRSANDLHRTLNMAQLDNETDSIKYEKRVRQPKLLRYVPTSDVEENYVHENFETHDMKPEETPRRYSFTKKPKNPADGSVHYAYSRSSSNCSSPTGNLPTIAEHVEHYGTYRVRTPSPSESDVMKGFDVKKLDKYFVNPKISKTFSAKGSHPDSLYRVAPGTSEHGKVRRAVQLLRWPACLLFVCVALTVFVYFLMPVPDTDSEYGKVNETYWETAIAGAHSHHGAHNENDKTVLPIKQLKKSTVVPSGKTPEIDFYDSDNNNANVHKLLDKLRDMKANSKLPVQPVFPSHIAPEVQYGNEKADTDKLRSPKVLTEDHTVIPLDSTLKPHITQNPEKPLAIYFNEDAVTISAETVAKLQPNDFVKYENRNGVETNDKKSYQIVQSETRKKVNLEPELHRNGQYNVHHNIGTTTNFTSGHSKVFGVGKEDAEKFRSTTQSTLYNTKVSPTLPVWRDGDDTTTIKYPVNSVSDGQLQCRSTRLSICRDVLPYDLATMTSISPGGVDINSLLPQIEFLVSSNCSDRVKHFACALLEPECSVHPELPRLPCQNLCKAVAESCEGAIPRELASTLNCQLYPSQGCAVAAAPCSPREAQCGDGQCVLREWLCNGRQDCSNGEDELGCSVCDRSEFRCRDNSCIQKRWLCDGYADCADGEDEAEATCDGRGGHQLVASGSAPAPSVTRPNRIAYTGSRIEAESSKELLMTSDSSNALRRNYTRRPTSSRLTPYSRTYPTKPVDTTTKLNTDSVSNLNNSLPLELKPVNTTQIKEALGFRRFSPRTTPRVRSRPVQAVTDKLDKNELKENKSAQQVVRVVAETARVNPKRLDEMISSQQYLAEPQIEQMKSLDDTINTLVRIIEEVNSEPESLDVASKEVEEPKSIIQEQPYSSHSSPCPAGELRCVDGRCITIAQLCDGTIDCSDHADEDNCFT